ncbi:FG-GAP repeat domain-containing protein [Pedobacter antarcticus]|uniref:FG-GAP repeat domain-containing protein n=1 Tax=Pedobacter antarcticus TaxID=34086 RepID=UPI0008816DF7|nr:VCBS repeat-containing protein [Pedobacter antarcticus]SDM37516.1 Repeat domain-containing protein [Pedobacter antarcticus]
MQHSLFRKFYTITATLCLVVMHNAISQSTETKYFNDVTTTHLPIDADAHTLDVVLEDVNGDGHLDAILALESLPNRLYLNDGTGKFIWKKGVFAKKSHDTEHVRAGDFDKDGHLDIIFVAEDDQNHEFYLGNGDGTFRNVSERLPAKSEANGLDIGDVNGDGLLDIIVGNTGPTPQNLLWINNPEKPGHFIDYTRKGLPAIRTETQSVKLSDLNGDGFLDLIAGNEVPPNRLFFNDGKGHFTEHPEKLDLLAPLHTREVLTFDANGDGHPDILFLNLTSNGGKFEKDPTTRLLINDGKGNFKDETAKRIPKQTYSSYAGAIFDFNHDGSPDIILSAIKIPPFEAMQVQALQNDGKGNFKLVTDQVIPASTVGRSWGIAVGDVNGDGKPDIFIGQWGTQARLLLGK